MTVSKNDYHFIVDDLYKKTEGGYSYLGNDPETYASNTRVEWVNILTHMKPEHREMFPAAYQPLLKETAKTSSTTRKAEIASHFMQEAGRLMTPFEGNVQPAEGRPKRSIYKPLGHLSSEQMKFFKAMEVVSVEHTYEKYMHATRIDQYPDCVRTKMVKSSVNGGAIRAKAQLVGAMYETQLLTPDEFAVLHIPPEALASKSPFSVDHDKHRKELYTSDKIDKFLLSKLENLPANTEALLSRRFSVMRNDFHENLIEKVPSKEQFAKGWHNATFAADAWKPAEEYQKPYDSKSLIVVLNPTARYIEHSNGKDEVELKINRDISFTYSVDSSQDFVNAKKLPPGIRILKAGENYDEHQHPGPHAISNPYPDEATAVYISAYNQKPYFIPLSRLAKQVQEATSSAGIKEKGFWASVTGAISDKPVVHDEASVQLMPENGKFRVRGYEGRHDPQNDLGLEMLAIHKDGQPIKASQTEVAAADAPAANVVSSHVVKSKPAAKTPAKAAAEKQQTPQFAALLKELGNDSKAKAATKSQGKKDIYLPEKDEIGHLIASLDMSEPTAPSVSKQVMQARAPQTLNEQYARLHSPAKAVTTASHNDAYSPKAAAHASAVKYPVAHVASDAHATPPAKYDRAYSSKHPVAPIQPDGRGPYAADAAPYKPASGKSRS